MLETYPESTHQRGSILFPSLLFRAFPCVTWMSGSVFREESAVSLGQASIQGMFLRVSRLFSQAAVEIVPLSFRKTGKMDVVQNWKETLRAKMRLLWSPTRMSISHVFFRTHKNLGAKKSHAPGKGKKVETKTGKGSRSKIRRYWRKTNLLDPSLRGLDGEEGDHGRRAVVVVERLQQPFALGDLWQLLAELAKFKVFSPEKKWKSLMKRFKKAKHQTVKPYRCHVLDKVVWFSSSWTFGIINFSTNRETGCGCNLHLRLKTRFSCSRGETGPKLPQQPSN